MEGSWAGVLWCTALNYSKCLGGPLTSLSLCKPVFTCLNAWTKAVWMDQFGSGPCTTINNKGPSKRRAQCTQFAPEGPHPYPMGQSVSISNWPVTRPHKPLNGRFVSELLA